MATNVKYKQRVGEDLFLELTLKWSGEAADLTNAVNTKLHIEQIGRPWNKYHGFTITGNVVSMQLTAEENTHCGIFNATFSADIPNANSSTGYVTRKWDFRYLYMIVATSDEEALSDTVESTGEIAKYGSDGLSAYDIAVNNGYVGTEAEWIASLKNSAASVTKESVEEVLTGTITSHNHDTQYVKLKDGYALSKNDFTDLLYTKLSGLANYDDTSIKSSISSLQSRIDTLVSGSASTAIDTFNEIVAFLNGMKETDSLQSIISGIGTSISNAISTSEAYTDNAVKNHNESATAHADIRTEVSKKVDSVSGKGLSANDFTDAYKAKVDGIGSGAGDYVLTKANVEAVLTGDITSHNHATEIAAALTDYVQKVAGKGLSTEDFTTELKAKLSGLSNYDDTSVQSSITSLQNTLNTLMSGNASTAIESFNEIIAFLKNVSDSNTLEGIVSGINTTMATNLATAKSYADAQIAAHNENGTAHSDMRTLIGNKVDKADGMGLSSNDYTTAEKNKLAGLGSGGDYTLTKAAVEGALTGDITSHNHATQIATALADYVKAVAGKGLSTNDLTDALLTKLNGLSNYDDTTLKGNVSSLQTQMNTLLSANASTAIESFNEIIAFLANVTDSQTLEGIISGINTTIANNLSTAETYTDNAVSTHNQSGTAHSDLRTLIATKVDTVSGKGLSSNDYTDAEKTKLSGIASGANVNVIEGVQLNGTDLAITNKKVNVVTSPPSVATTTADGLMSSTDKSKLDGITESADAVSVSQTLNSGTEVGSVTVNGIATKLYAPKHTQLTFTDVSASTWVSDTTYTDYPYKCVLTCSGVLATDFAEVVLGVTEAVSGNYAPICLTAANSVTIYSKVNTTITIPTINIVRI